MSEQVRSVDWVVVVMSFRSLHRGRMNQNELVLENENGFCWISSDYVDTDPTSPFYVCVVSMEEVEAR